LFEFVFYVFVLLCNFARAFVTLIKFTYLLT